MLWVKEMNNHKYVRLCKSVFDSGELLEEHDAWDKIQSGKEYYFSIFYYNDDQYNIWKERKSVAGIRDVKTNKLVFDLDFKSDPDYARREGKIILYRLVKAGVKEEDIQLYFSGSKGFHVIVELDRWFSPEEAKAAAFSFSGGVKLDLSLYDNSQLLRVAGTRHPKTGLYKIPLTMEQFQNLSMQEIRSLAESVENIGEFNWGVSHLNDECFIPQVVEKEVKSVIFSLENKPKFLTNCRWFLQNGHFKEGDRNSALLCLAATYKNLGFDLEHVYRMLKGVAELQSRLTDGERYADEELYNNIVMQVFSDTWQGGQFTCRSPGWLQDYCQALNQQGCKHDKDASNEPSTLLDVSPSYREYVINIENNTIKTGIKTLDENILFTTGSNVLLIGAPASGKTSVALNILSNTSKSNLKSVFASLDMHRNRMFEKALFKVSGLKREEIYEKFKNGEEAELLSKIQEEFGNVFFFNKSCPSVQDVRDYVVECQEKAGEKIKLVMIDYFERISSDYSDDTQASKRVAGQLQDMVNDLDICLMTLVQPNKMALAGGIDTPIYDYTKIKGSSFVYQSARQIVSLWRPFGTPKYCENDQYLQMAVIKNDLGPLSEFAFKWNGGRGEISELEDHDWTEFDRLLAWKAQQEGDSDGDWD